MLTPAGVRIGCITGEQPVLPGGHGWQDKRELSVEVLTDEALHYSDRVVGTTQELLEQLNRGVPLS